MSAALLRAFGVLLMLSALALSLSRAPERPVETLVARWAPPPSDFIEVRGQVVHLRDEGPRGDPLPILLLHGTASSLHTWQGWAQQLRKRRRVIRIDLPGAGLTGPWSPGFSASYPHEDYQGDAGARFVLDLLDTLKVDRVVLGGQGYGGEIAWRTAALAPARVAALVLVDASGPAYVPTTVPLLLRLAGLPPFDRVLEWVLPRAVVAQGLADAYGDPAKVTEEQVDRQFELLLREGNRRALGRRLQHTVNAADAGRIAGLRLPTLILWGSRDRLIPLPVAQRFREQIAGSQLVVFEGLGHLPQEEDPVRTVLAVSAFLGLD